MSKHRICYIAGTHGNWGGASRVLFTNLSLLDRNRFEPIVLLSMNGPAEALLEDMGIECQVWGWLTEPGNHLKYLHAMLRMFIWLKRQHIELFHLNRANDWRPAELLAIRLSKIPVVTHFHTVNLDKAPATRWSTVIAAVSQFVAQNSYTQGVPTKVLYNTVDLARFAHGRNLRSQFGIHSDQIVISFVGQIREIKGVEDFISMTRLIANEDVRFLLVGERPNKKSISDAYTNEELQAWLKQDPRITYCGYVEQIENVYHTTDILVVPSRCEEAFGLICIEAGAAGVPIVATRQGGLPEVIEDGITGFLVDVGDFQNMAQQVQKLIADPQRRTTMGQAARTRIETEFTEKPVRALEDLYESLLAPYA